MQALSQHTLLEFYDCDPARLKRSREVKKVLCESVLRGGGTIVKALFHNFNPYGVSGVVVITESHVTIHTWPEHAYAAVDIFSCSKKLNHQVIRDRLKRALSSQRVTGKTFLRGFSPGTAQAQRGASRLGTRFSTRAPGRPAMILKRLRRRRNRTRESIPCNRR
jgi:S-adenosylmethionine decarboxylase